MMGSVLRSLVLAYDDAKEFMVEKERRAEREINQLRPAALLRWDGALPLPLDEQRRIVQRWIEYEKRKGPRRYDFLKGEMFACIARPHVRIALRYYNSHHPGAEFDAVRSLNAHFASFRGDDWSHVNFLARRRGCIDAPVLRFFAEISYHGHLAIKPVFVSCTILREEPLFVRRIETVQEPVHLTTKRGANQEQIVHKYRSKCAFCPDPAESSHPSDDEFDLYAILHPSDDEFVCGKEGQEVGSSWLFYVEERALDHILVRQRNFLDDVTDSFYFVFCVFFIWLAKLARIPSFFIYLLVLIPIVVTLILNNN